MSLLLRCGPHWLQLAPSALPISFVGGSTGGVGSGGGAGSSRVPPVQVRAGMLAWQRQGLHACAHCATAQLPHQCWCVGACVCAAPSWPHTQVLLPVYGSSVVVALLLHRRGHAVGRCVFKLYGLLPLMLRDHTKTLTLYR